MVLPRGGNNSKSIRKMEPSITALQPLHFTCSVQPVVVPLLPPSWPVPPNGYIFFGPLFSTPKNHSL